METLDFKQLVTEESRFCESAAVKGGQSPAESFEGHRTPIPLGTRTAIM